MNDNQPPIAIGRTAEIFPYADGKVLKLFLPTVPHSWIDKELEIGRYIQEVDLPVPKVYERVEISNRVGIVYERIEGPSLLHELATKPWNVVRHGRILAKLHVQIHTVQAPAHLENQREWATGGIPASDKLSSELKARILQLRAALPNGNILCHGDFHPGNIILTPNGPVIIDWMTVSKGVAAGDVARTLIILEAAKTPDDTPLKWLIEWIRKLFLSTYLNTYLQLHPEIKESLAGWKAVMAANFLSDVSIAGEEGDLKAIIARCLQESGN